MTRKDKIQCLLIRHLMAEGEIALTLPDGMTLEVGITKEGKNGSAKRSDYCWVQTTQDERATFMDSYSLHMSYPEGTVVCGDVGGTEAF